MKTKQLPILSNSCSTSPNGKTVDNSQICVATKVDTVKRNRSKAIQIETNETKNTSGVVKKLHDLSEQFSQLPTLLSGPLRHLKIEPHYREPTSRLWLSPQTYRKTSKIRLTGNWIEKAGFKTRERIRVIPMHRMLVIVPETQIDTNENE